MRDWLEYRRSLEVFLKASRNFSDLDKSEILSKEFGAFGDCPFLIYVEDYNLFLKEFLSRFDANRSISERGLGGAVNVESEFDGLIYPCSINGFGSSMERDRQRSEYNRGIVLGGPTKEWIKVFLEVGDFLQERKIPFCVPKVSGRKYYYLDGEYRDDLTVCYFPKAHRNS